jgi:hypothetical protein
MTCPTCGKTARVVLDVEDGEGGVQRMTVALYSCPSMDFTTEETVLRTLGLR